MRVDFDVRASQTVLRHPWHGMPRIGGRPDSRTDLREMADVAVPQGDLGQVADDWERRLHRAIGAAWSCTEAAPCVEPWDVTIADLTRAGMRMGLPSCRGWNEGDKAECQAIGFLVVHVRPTTVVETDVEHGVTTRLILERLERIGHGRLWSVDLLAVDPALHQEKGFAVPWECKARWTYVEGTSRDRPPRLVNDVGQIDLFGHDSLDTGRNVCFELDTVWRALRPGAIAVVDDVDGYLGFSKLTDRTDAHECPGARHVTEMACGGGQGAKRSMSSPNWTAADDGTHVRAPT